MAEERYRYRHERKQAEKERKHQQRSRIKKGKHFKILLLICSVIVFFVFGAVAVAFASMVKDAPELDPAKLVDPLSTKFYDINGNFIYEYGLEKRTKISYEQIPKVLEQAFIATEDSRFYEHHGIDLKRTTKAIWVNVTGDFGSQGGSTITQQVIKNSFLNPEKTIKRKVQEWNLAYQLEKKYSKQDILMMYLNKIYLGNRSYGVAAAAQNYFGIGEKDLKNLTLSQAALLAGLPQSPNNYDPTIPENVEAATERRSIVLRSMVREGYITEQQMEEAARVPVTEGVIPRDQQPNMPYEAFLDATFKEVKKKLKDVDISTDGLSIYTTLDPKAQEYAETMLNTNEIVRYPDDEFQGAFAFLDTKTGEVRAIGSGRNHFKTKLRGTNMAIEMQRQPGSTFKPIFDYGPAIEHLKWSTGHLINDQATSYETGQPLLNWDKQYHGMVSIRKALQYSYNIPALLTMREVGIEKAKNFSEQLGISFHNGTVYESYSIGANAVNPLSMAGAYSAFGNNGVYNLPHFVKKVVYPDGKEVNFTNEPKQVMQDYTAFMVTDMLRTVVDSGTGMMANIPELDMAGKTGTTNFNAETRAKLNYPENATNDSWFVGYTPQYTMAVWTGYVKNEPNIFMAGDTTKIAHVMFREMMRTFNTDNSQFLQPASVYSENNEWFITGVPSAETPAQTIINKGPENPVSHQNKAFKDSKQKGKKQQQGKGKGNGKGKNK
ncbi:transglycosylase domain-containing protein [Bacillus coreaensis]